MTCFAKYALTCLPLSRCLCNHSDPAADVAVFDVETCLYEEKKGESMFRAGMTMAQLDRVTSQLILAYDGERDDRNRRHGQGSFISARTGNTYKGSYHNDKKHGHGVMVFHNGDMYDGKLGTPPCV
jgi:Xaa-Pro aminopeptidase